MSILNVNKINPVGGGSTVTIAGIASVTNNISVGNSVTAGSFVGPIEGNVTATTIVSNSDVLIGTTTKGYSGGDDLTISTSGDTGMTIRSGTSSQGTIAFSDGTSGADEYRGYVQYLHNGNALLFGTDATERLRITSDGQLKLAGLTLSQRNSATGVNGGLIYNSDAKVFQYYDGSGWISLNTTNQIVATGGNSVATSDGYRIHTFTGGGTFVITSGFGEVEVLVVGGGGSEGGGGSGCHGGGGGGGGGVVYQKINLYVGNYPISIGSGGSWRNNGGNTVFGNGTDNTITALGGGAGGPTLTGNGNAGGSGGGGSRHDTSNQGGAASQPSSADGGFGNAGGNTGSNTNPGGGGGAGGAGNSGSAGSNPGRGGPGKQFTQFGVNTYFGAGGNGNGGGSSTGPEGQTGTSSNGAANTGAGGGGSPGTGTRYSGGSGIVLVRYPAAS